jgi:integrase/recombinase XerD
VAPSRGGVEFLAAYTLDQRRRGLSETTISKRALTYRSFAAWITPRDLLDATEDDIMAWIDGRRVGPSTRAWHISNLACLYDYGVAWDWLERSPMRRIQRPRWPKGLPRPISDEDLMMALELADARTRCWLLLAAYDGLRAQEVAGLRREDVLDSHDPELLAVRKGKGNKERVVPLNRHVRIALHEFGMPRSGWLWPGQRGPLRPNTVSRYVARFLQGIGVNATLHQGRHFFATRVYRETKDLRLVQALLGHEDITTTARYTKVVPLEGVDVVRDLSAGPARVPT